MVIFDDTPESTQTGEQSGEGVPTTDIDFSNWEGGLD